MGVGGLTGISAQGPGLGKVPREAQEKGSDRTPREPALRVWSLCPGSMAAGGDSG